MEQDQILVSWETPYRKDVFLHPLHLAWIDETYRQIPVLALGHQHSTTDSDEMSSQFAFGYLRGSNEDIASKVLVGTGAVLSVAGQISRSATDRTRTSAMAKGAEASELSDGAQTIARASITQNARFPPDQPAITHSTLAVA